MTPQLVGATAGNGNSLLWLLWMDTSPSAPRPALNSSSHIKALCYQPRKKRQLKCVLLPKIPLSLGWNVCSRQGFSGAELKPSEQLCSERLWHKEHPSSSGGCCPPAATPRTALGGLAQRAWEKERTGQGVLPPLLPLTKQLVAALLLTTRSPFLVCCSAPFNVSITSQRENGMICRI